jgi:hypothetical protein
MIENNFDDRTLANMNVALERVCDRSRDGEQHPFRKRVAQSILRSAKAGRVSLAALTAAGKQALSNSAKKDRRPA